MTVEEVVERVAKEGWVEECIKTVAGGVWRSEYSDLVQDVLIELLNQTKVVDLYKKGQLKFYIMRVVRNNIQSATSRFYYRYRRFSLLNQGDKALSNYDGQEKM